MTDMLNLFNELEDNTRVVKHKDEVLRAPFGYIGGKSKSLSYILPQLPYRKGYIEPFGGSAAVLLARQPSDFEVYNDRYAGVVAFYRCMRDDKKCDSLIKWLSTTINSREEFQWCRHTWDTCGDDVERAARWYYMNRYSFNSMGRNFGRSLNSTMMSKKFESALGNFSRIHARLRHVMVENQDYMSILRDFDSEDSVFYLDPPYLDVRAGTYKHNMTSESDHRILLDFVMGMKAYVAVSTYENKIYSSYSWSDVQVWNVPVSVQAQAFTESNAKLGMEHMGRDSAYEYLFIKE